MALSDRLLRGHADRHPSGAADALPAEGCSRAQKRGQRMGRKPKLREPQQHEARKRRAEGATLAELARRYGVGKSTISRLTGLSSPDPLT
jgi:hypothetical protein